MFIILDDCCRDLLLDRLPYLLDRIEIGRIRRQIRKMDVVAGSMLSDKDRVMRAEVI